MSGELRLNMAGMSMLQVLYLSHNKLLEPLPWGLFTHLALEQLTLLQAGHIVGSDRPLLDRNGSPQCQIRLRENAVQSTHKMM